MSEHASIINKLSIKPVEALSIITLMDNVVDSIAPNHGPAKRPGSWANIPRASSSTMEEGWLHDSLQAEHGFSALVSVTIDRETHRILFDAGCTARGTMENMRRLGISLEGIEAVVLSHGHYDHTAGMEGLIESTGQKELPLLVHPDFWIPRRQRAPDGKARVMPTLKKAALVAAGFKIVEEQNPSCLCDRSILLTGGVERTTEFETGMPGQEGFVEGDWRPHEAVPDEQSLVIHVRDKGLVVLTGCGHAGIVNTVRYARKLTGIQRVYAVIGGFHLNGAAFAPRIPATLDAFVEFAPQYLVPTHCTGWQAMHALASHFPDAFIQNTVGTRFDL